MKVKLEFSGGMDLLFGNKKLHEVELAEGGSGKEDNQQVSTCKQVQCLLFVHPQSHENTTILTSFLSCLPCQSKWTVGRVIMWARENLLTERPELFMKGDSV